MKKDELISFRVDEETKEAFEAFCLEFHTTASHELRLFVYQTIKQSKARQIPLNEYRKKHK